MRGVPSTAVVVIPCGVEMPTAAPARPRSTYQGALRILAIGRLVPKKGLDDLLVAVASAAAAGLVSEIRIIGDGPARGRLEALAEASRGTGVTVRLLGPLARSQHAEHLSWANVFCLPCKIAPDGDRDSMPLAIKEAVVSGLPVVTTTAVGIPEMLDSSTAVLVAPGDASALASALAAFHGQNAASRRDLAVAAYQHVAKHFAMDQTGEALYRLLLHGELPTQWSHDDVA